MYPFKTATLHHHHVNTSLSGGGGGVGGVQNLNIPPPISSSSVAAVAPTATTPNNLIIQNPLLPPPTPTIQQWPLNQADYQNVANDQVDWAALAQQWIYMKETSTTDDLLAAPPPPIISKREFAEEQGEAPMEVEKDDEDLSSVTMNLDTPLDLLSKQWAMASGTIVGELATNPNGPWQSSSIAASVQQSQWRKKPGWNTWTNPNMPPGMQLQQQQPQQQQQQQQSPTTNILNRPPPFLSNEIHPSQQSFSNLDSVTQLDVNSDSYWQRVSAIPSLMDTQINEPPIKPLMSAEQEYPSPLDAAKRKTLPTWIRQGLEKMEREKQKLAEKEKERQEHAALVEKRKLVAAAEVENSLAAGEIPFIVKSKFDSDSDSDDDVVKKVPILHASSSASSMKRTKERSKSPFKIEISNKSKQEQLQELMLLVRGSLTEILLEVTNEEIRNIATETLSKTRFKARTAQTVKKSALTSLTGGLGLGIYADSDNSGESSDYDDDNEEDNKKKDIDSKNNKKESDNESDGNDSYYELQESIKRRKTAFESKSRDIEKSLALEAEKERRWLGDDEDDNHEINDDEELNTKERHKNGSNTLKKPLSFDRNDYKNNYYQRNISSDHLSGSGGGSAFKETGEIQHEKNYVNYHGRMGERKTTRFSDPKDTVKTMHLTHGSIIFENSVVPSQNLITAAMSSIVPTSTNIQIQIPTITQHNISATKNSLLTGGLTSTQRHHKRNNDSSENSNSPSKSKSSSRKHSKSKKKRQNSTEDDEDNDNNDRNDENDRYRHRSKREKSRDRHRHHRNRRSRSSSSDYDRYRSSSHHNRHHKSSHSNSSRNPSSKSSSSRYDRHNSYYDDDRSDSYRRSHSRERSTSTKNGGGGGGGNGSRKRSRSRSKSKDSKYSSHSRNAE